MQKWSLHYVAWCFALCINSSPPVQAQTFTIALHEDSLALRPCKEKVTQLYQALDMPIELIELPGRRSLKYANDGKTDAELCRIGQITKRYRNLVKISPALMSLDFIALTKSRWPAVTQLSDLDHARIGTSRGMMAAEMVL